MALKPPIASGNAFEIRYAADASSLGPALVAATFIPNQGAQVPDPMEMYVAPGVESSLNGTIPSADDARRLDVFADLPEPTGGGTLSLFVAGHLVHSARIEGDRTWKFVVL